MKLRLLMAGLVIFGGWQTGQGAYTLAKAELAQWLLEEAWLEMRKQIRQAPGAGGIPPWPWADTWPMVKLHWPDLDQELIVLSGASGRNLAFGPAHLSASVPPGQKGVSVIGGHRDTHFEFLQNVVAGDQLLVEQVDGSLTTFRVSEIYITDVRHSRIALDSAVPKIALVACYPFVDWQAGSPLRYLVIAEAVSRKLEQVPPTSAEMLTTISL